MIYRVVLDGVDILDYQSKDLSLISPVLELEVNNAGSLEFVMPPNHTYYNDINMLTSTIEVYEDDTLIWFGRPVDETIDFYKQKKIYCEGPFSFLNDTIQRPHEYENVSIYDFFNDVIANHNSQITNQDRKFEVGQITVDTTWGYRKLNYETSHDAIQSMCLDTNDGYLFFRRENGTNYIDWFAEMPFQCNQSIEFGVNLLNYRSSFSGGDFATCVLPLGKTQKDTNEPLTIRSINNGSDVLRSIAAEQYGNIIKVQQYSDIDDQMKLLEEAQKFLENNQFNSLVIECSAADLHSILPEKEIFRVGQTIHCTSTPHLIDRDFPISKMTINLDSAAKTITLGIMKKKTLTRIYKEDTESADSYSDSDGSSGYIGGIVEDPLGELWELVLPDVEGGEITAKKAPTHIEVSKPPNKDEYYLGETIDYSGISVNIWCEDKIWTNPPRYLDGKAPYSELSFPMASIPRTYEDTDNTGSSFHIFVPVVWYYKGQKYQTTTILNVINQLITTSTSGISNAINANNVEVKYQYGGKISMWFTATGENSNNIEEYNIFFDNPGYAIMMNSPNSNDHYTLYMFTTSNPSGLKHYYHIYDTNNTQRLDTQAGWINDSGTFMQDKGYTGGYPHFSTITFTLHDTKIYAYKMTRIYHHNPDYGAVVGCSADFNHGKYSGPDFTEANYTDDWIKEVMYQIVSRTNNLQMNGGR